MTAKPRPRWLVLATLALLAPNLRMALSSVPAVIPDIDAATGWSATALGLLTMLPVLCMGAFALIVPRVAHRFGKRRTVAFALALITIALTVRLASLVPGVLHASALLAGIGIALAAGLVPGIVREQLPTAIGAATGLWSAAMMTGAALAAALTAPLESATGSWQVALALWALPAALALVVWLQVEGGHEAPAPAQDAAVGIGDLPWRNPNAWALTAFLALNSIVFYTTLAWLAPSYVDRGMTKAHAGLLFGLFTAFQVIGALVLPFVAERSARRQAIYAASLAVGAVGVLGVGFPLGAATAPVLAVFGVAIGGAFAMGLALLSEWAADARASARLTAMAFTVTYLTASIGPLTAGALLDANASWTLIYSLLAVVIVGQFAAVPFMRRGVRIQ